MEIKTNQGGTMDAPIVKPKRVSKAQQLVDSGLALNLKDAREQLVDMGGD